jgi:hypothetical protein
MNNEKTVGQPKRTPRKVLRGLLFGSLSLTAILFAAHLVWKYSGSNEWRLNIDRGGVQVYSLKAPGTTLKQFKAVTRVKTTLNRSLAPMVLTDLETCAEWVPGCNDMKVIQPWNPREMTSIWLWVIDFDPPFSQRREFLIKTHVTLEPEKKAFRVDNFVFPDLIPRNECCIRVTYVRNTWRYTDIGNGEVQVELAENMDLGIPYILFNYQGGDGLYELFSRMPELLTEEKYRNANFDFIDQMESMNRSN